MDEYLLNVLNESNKIISKLQLLSNFFENETVYKIYLRSQIIHKLFENNNDLDASKLELFHVQFTNSVIDLLKKIKKNNEKNVSVLYDEIQLNKDLITKLNESVYTDKSFNLDKQRQTLKVNTSLRRLYQLLSADSSDFPFSKNMISFSSRYSKDFFYDISPDLLEQFITYENEKVYVHNYATIEKKLLGKLCKYDFKCEFYRGLKAGTIVIEVYKLIDSEIYFSYHPTKNQFLFCDAEKIKALELENTRTHKATIMQDLQYKIDRLEGTIGLSKTHIPNDIETLLSDSYEKISDISFLDNMSNADVQANILKTMLNTDIM